jgi:hypothetical protein
MEFKPSLFSSPEGAGSCSIYALSIIAKAIVGTENLKRRKMVLAFQCKRGLRPPKGSGFKLGTTEVS